MKKLKEEYLLNNYIAKKAMENEYFLELMNKLENLFFQFIFKNEEIIYFEKKELNDLLRFADIFSSSILSSHRNLANRIISLLHSFYKDSEIYRAYAKDVFIKLGLFLSLQIDDQIKNNNILPLDIEILYNYKRNLQSDPDLNIIYTDTQYKIVNKINNSNHFSLSAPTSFGKTLIIMSFINKILKEKGKSNICILVPTNALLNEISINMKRKYENQEGYKVKIVNYPDIYGSHHKYDNLIFVFTPERLNTFFSNSDIKIDYLFVDEAQKVINKDDERSPLFYHVISLAEFKSIKIYFLTPHISNPELLLELFDKDKNLSEFVSDKLVVQNKIFIDLFNEKFDYLNFKDEIVPISCNLELNKDDMAKSLYDIYNQILNNESTLIYFNSKRKLLETLYEFNNYCQVIDDDELNNLSLTISKEIHNDYFLVDTIKKRIAFHFGDLPKHIRVKVEELFKNGKIKVLFTTSSLLEGVNLPAKNIIVTSDRNGLNKLSDIDFSNLIGRAGRYGTSYFGNVIFLKSNYNLNTSDYNIMKSSKDLKIKSEIMNTNRSKNFYKDIKEIITNKSFISNDLTEKQKDILLQYSNIVLYQNEEKINSKLISNLKFVNNDENILNNKNIEFFKINEENKNIIREHISIPLFKQKQIFEDENHDITQINIEDVNLDDCRNLLKIIVNSYNLNFEKINKRIYYFGSLLYKWISGIPMNVIIIDNLTYYKTNPEKYYDQDERTYSYFNIQNKLQVNSIINNVMSDIERLIKHEIKQYISNYIHIKINTGQLSEEYKRIIDYVEFGTKKVEIIDMQKIGLSRELAKYIYQEHKDLIYYDYDELNIHLNELIEVFDSNSYLYSELLDFIVE